MEQVYDQDKFSKYYKLDEFFDVVDGQLKVKREHTENVPRKDVVELEVMFNDMMHRALGDRPMTQSLLCEIADKAPPIKVDYTVAPDWERMELFQRMIEREAIQKIDLFTLVLGNGCDIKYEK